MRNNVLFGPGYSFMSRGSQPHILVCDLARPWCVRETEILVEQQPPQGVLVCDHAGLVINKFFLTAGNATRTDAVSISLEECLLTDSPGKNPVAVPPSSSALLAFWYQQDL